MDALNTAINNADLDIKISTISKYLRELKGSLDEAIETFNSQIQTASTTVPKEFSTATDISAVATAVYNGAPIDFVYTKFKDTLVTISFGANGDHKFRLVSVSSDTASSGGTCALTFLSEDCIGRSPMAPSSTNSGGYDKSATTMKSYLMTLFESMDTNWKSIVKPVDKEYGTSLTTKETMTEQTLWIPSMYEVALSDPATHEPNCGKTYTYFIGESATGESAKRIRNESNTATSWWLRSGYFEYALHFASCNNKGSCSNSGAVGNNGVAIGFCV